MAIDPDLPFVLAGLAIVAGTVISLARIFVNRRPSEGVAPAELRQIEERLARIEQAVDSIAIETERISEGQRFTTRLLADRASQPAAPRPPGG
ncbi:MAG: hypothetical protein WBQ26_04320 [Gemmatimonadaceae bacterium]|nr:hypothetical protein [Gemmatimonadaceae bacterium]